MKRIIFFSIMLALVLFAFVEPIKPQNATLTYVMDFGTVANSTLETGYFNFLDFAKQQGFNRVDSISVGCYVVNETDIDSIDLYMGYTGYDGKGSAYQSVLGTYTVTLDVADASKGYERLLSSGATLLTGAAIRGYNSIKVNLRPRYGSGNDATDPNKACVVFYLWAQ